MNVHVGLNIGRMTQEEQETNNLRDIFIVRLKARRAYARKAPLTGTFGQLYNFESNMEVRRLFAN